MRAQARFYVIPGHEANPGDRFANSPVVLAQARTHYHRPLFCEGNWPRVLSIDSAVWVLAFARTTREIVIAIGSIRYQ
jgi:hypothetical protein